MNALDIRRLQLFANIINTALSARPPTARIYTLGGPTPETGYDEQLKSQYPPTETPDEEEDDDDDFFGFERVETLNTKRPKGIVPFLGERHRSGQSQYLPHGGTVILEVDWPVLNQICGPQVFNMTQASPQANWEVGAGTPLQLNLDVTTRGYLEGRIRGGFQLPDRLIIMPINFVVEERQRDTKYGGVDVQSNNLDAWSKAFVMVHELGHHQQRQQDWNAQSFFDYELDSDDRAFQYLEYEGLSADEAALVARYATVSPTFGNILGNQIKKWDYLNSFFKVYSDPKQDTKALDHLLRKDNLTAYHIQMNSLDPEATIGIIREALNYIRVPFVEGSRFTIPGMATSLASLIAVKPVPRKEYFYSGFDETFLAGKNVLYLWHSPINTLQWIFLKTSEELKANSKLVPDDDADKNAFLSAFDEVYRALRAQNRKR